MKILGVELDFDFCDADQAEVYEREVKRAVERVQDKKQYEGKSNADSMRLQCRIIDEFFDAVFGGGTTDMLFRGKSNLREHLEAFAAVSDAARESQSELFALADRYAPNRAARRQEQKLQAKKEKRHENHLIRQIQIQNADSNSIPGTEPAPEPTQDQIAFIKKFAQMMPEMEAWLKQHQ